jgi:hypothetical protein
MRIQSTVAFTRQQLYQRVWSKPLSVVAKEVGVSGNALARICSRLLVPYPSRGHWAKVGGGKAPVRPSLPAAPEVNMRRITSCPAAARWPSAPSLPDTPLLDQSLMARTL